MVTDASTQGRVQVTHKIMGQFRYNNLIEIN